MKKSLYAFAIVSALMLSVSASAASCNVQDARVCAIDAKLQAQVATKVEYVDAAVSADAATAVEYDWVAPGKHIIRIGDTRAMDDKALMFALAHEYSRAASNHGRQLVEVVTHDDDKQMSNKDLLAKYGFHAAAVKPSLKVFNHKKVHEADALAVVMLGNVGEDPLAAMQSALAERGATATHPSRATRIEKAKAFLEKQNS
jgi:hypothetical protein